MHQGREYTTEELQGLVEKAREIIPKDHVHFECDLWRRLNISTFTVSKYGFDKNSELLGLLEKEADGIKEALRAKWGKSDNATLQVCLYKLLARKSEQDALAYQKHEVVGKDDTPLNMEFKLFKLINNATDNQDIRPASGPIESTSASGAQ